MISEIANDLLTKITSISDLATRTSFSLGGNAEDVKLIAIPACVLLMQGDHVYEDQYSSSGPMTHEPGIVPGTQMMLATFSALVIVPYGTDDEILNTQFPLLEAVSRAVHGKTAPSDHRWRYIGQTKRFIYPDRIGYEQRYTLEWTL